MAGRRKRKVRRWAFNSLFEMQTAKRQAEEYVKSAKAQADFQFSI